MIHTRYKDAQDMIQTRATKYKKSHYKSQLNLDGSSQTQKPKENARIFAKSPRRYLESIISEKQADAGRRRGHDSTLICVGSQSRSAEGVELHILELRMLVLGVELHMFVLLRLYLDVFAVPVFPLLRLIEFLLLILSVLFEVEDATHVEHQHRSIFVVPERAIL